MAPASGYLVPSSQMGLPRQYTIEETPPRGMMGTPLRGDLDAIIPPIPESADFPLVQNLPPEYDVSGFALPLPLPEYDVPPRPLPSCDTVSGPPLQMAPQPSLTPPRHAIPRDPSSPLDVPADRSTLSWVNTLLGWIWPKANKAMMQWVHEDFTPRLQDSLPAPFKGLHFSTFSLGKNTPDFGPVEVIQHSESHVQLDLEIRYVSDVDIMIDAGTGGITFGINQLKFAGRLCIVLRPLVNKWPLIGAMKWFFCNKPQVTLRFTGLGAVAQFPGMDTKVQSAVDEWIRSRAVLPNARVWHFTRNEDIVDPMEASSHQPLGVLRARVTRAWNVAGVNWSALAVDRFMSDPYCILKLGDMSHRSSTVVNTTNPVWANHESSGYFVVYHKDQGLEIDVIGDDSGRFLARNFVKFLGRTSSTVRNVMSWPQQSGPGNAQGTKRCSRVQLDTSNVSKEMLHVNDPVIGGVPSELEVEVEWFNLADRQNVPAATEHPMALLCVQLHKGFGFPPEVASEKHGLRWRSCLQIEGQPNDHILTSRKGHACDVEQIEFPDVPIHPRLHSVIDKLAERKFSIPEIAHIVGTDNPEVIDMYLYQKAEYIQKHQERARVQQHEDHRISLQWYETLTHFLHRLEPAALTLELMDSEDNVLGYVGPLSLRQLFSNSPVSAPRATHSLYIPQSWSAGGLAAWFTPARKTPTGAERFTTVELQLSAHLRYLQPARSLPKKSGSFLPSATAQSL